MIDSSNGLTGGTPESRDLAIVSSMRYKLTENAKKAPGIIGRGIIRLAVIVMVAIFLIGSAAGVWGYFNYGKGSDQFFSQRQTDERTCQVKVGKDTIQGRRYYTYKFTEIFGYRFISTDMIDERTELFLKSQGYSITSIQKDFSSTSKTVGIGLMGAEPMPRAAAWVITSNGATAVVTYDDFCKQLNPTNPFATE